MTDSFRCACGRVWVFPEYVQEHSYRQDTLICDCARVYIVLLGCVTLQSKPAWPWKRPNLFGPG
jgi:hypothetical protein